MKNIFCFIAMLITFNTNVFCQVGTYKIWKANENKQIALNEIIGDWYTSDSIQSKISFVKMGKNIVYIEGKKGGVGSPYSFRVDQKGIFVNGSAANWPPFYCTLVLLDKNLLEIKYWTFSAPKSTSIVYKRMRID